MKTTYGCGCEADGNNVSSFCPIHKKRTGTKMTDTLDKDGLPIFGAPAKKEEKVKKMSRIEERFREQAAKPVNWADNIRTARFKHHNFVSIEALYRAFKTRLLSEMEDSTFENKIEFTKSHPDDPYG